jgi:mono/diheme cytochrome c family protein
MSALDAVDGSRTGAQVPLIVARGKEVWQRAKCWECHGQEGKGDGQKAAGTPASYD